MFSFLYFLVLRDQRHLSRPHPSHSALLTRPNGDPLVANHIEIKQYYHAKQYIQYDRLALCRTLLKDDQDDETVYLECATPLEAWNTKLSRF